ncbi:MAG: hypothetical protein ACE5DX_01820 [Candidatus Dojkabacteria bacterium]
MATTPEDSPQQDPLKVQATTIVYAILAAAKGRRLYEVTDTRMNTLNYFQSRIKGDCTLAQNRGWIKEEDWDGVFVSQVDQRFLSGPQTRAALAIMKRRWFENSVIRRRQINEGLVRADLYDTALEMISSLNGGHDFSLEEDLLTDQFYATLEP